MGTPVKKVLVADDNAGSRELMRNLLEHMGFEFHEAFDGQAAVEVAPSLLPDLVILDIQMPRLDGFGAVRTMRADARLKAVPILALTASAMHTDRDKVLAAGFTAYITKPVSLSVLRAELAKLLS